MPESRGPFVMKKRTVSRGSDASLSAAGESYPFGFPQGRLLRTERAGMGTRQLVSFLRTAFE